VLRRLPPEYKYADLAVAAFDALVSLSPDYFTLDSHMSLRVGHRERERAREEGFP
jgi:hypothetical protein